MTVSGSYSSSVLGSLRESGSASVEVGVALIKKAQDLDKAQAEALLPDAPPQAPCASGTCGQHLDVYA